MYPDTLLVPQHRRWGWLCCQRYLACKYKPMPTKETRKEYPGNSPDSLKLQYNMTFIRLLDMTAAKTKTSSNKISAPCLSSAFLFSLGYIRVTCDCARRVRGGCGAISHTSMLKLHQPFSKYCFGTSREVCSLATIPIKRNCKCTCTSTNLPNGPSIQPRRSAVAVYWLYGRFPGLWDWGFTRRAWAEVLSQLRIASGSKVFQWT